MNDHIKVGLIGANPGGSWGATAHVPALRALDGFELTAVCTSSPETARNSANHFGIRHAFSDPVALATCPDVDLVTVCVRVPEHDRLVRAALDAGKHVYCEWPLGVNSVEAKALLDLAERKGVRHMIGLQVRKSPALRHMRDLVRDGAIGRMLSATVRHSGGWPIRIPASMPYLQLAETGANLETIRGGHSIDALCFVAGELGEISAMMTTQNPVVEVLPDNARAARTAPDQILAHGLLANGANVSIHIQGSPGRGMGFMLEINGTEGDLMILTGPGSSGIQMIEAELFRTEAGKVEPVPVKLPASYRDPAIDGLPPAVRNVARMYQTFRASLLNPAIEFPDFAAALARHETLDLLRAANASRCRTRSDDL